MIEEGKRGNSSPINENLSEFLGIEKGLYLETKQLKSLTIRMSSLQPVNCSSLVETIRIGAVGILSHSGKSPIHTGGADTDIR